MNGRTGTVTAVRTGSPPAGAQAAIPGARPAPAGGRRQRPGPGSWPLFAGLGPMGALPTAPGLARAFTVLVLGGWGLAGMSETTALVTSELTTNVVRAAAGGDGRPVYDADGRIAELWVRLMSDRARLRVEVWDSLPAAAGTPVPRHAAPDAESGRGLEIVRELSLDWGWHPIAGLAAKSAWALLAIHHPASDGQLRASGREQSS
jgi:hypothetical protein